MRFVVVALCLAMALAPLTAPAQSVRPDPQLTEGLRQLREGDYEGAVATLQAVVTRLSDDRTRSGEVTQALLHLGIAHVALDQVEAAKARFREALARDATLSLSPDRFSPKVIRTFEAARLEAQQAVKTSPAERRGRGGRTALIVIGAAGAAAAGIAIAAGGGNGSGGQTGSPSLSNARFGTPVLLCPDGSVAEPLPFTILVDAFNPSSTPLTINTVTTQIIIQTSSIPSEIGFARSEPSVASPMSIARGGRETVQVESRLICGNGRGDAPRVNEWSGRVTLSTSSGVFTLETPDRLRVNIP